MDFHPRNCVYLSLEFYWDTRPSKSAITDLTSAIISLGFGFGTRSNSIEEGLARDCFRCGSTLYMLNNRIWVVSQANEIVIPFFSQFDSLKAYIKTVTGLGDKGASYTSTGGAVKAWGQEGTSF
jgi:hypothetical protein